MPRTGLEEITPEMVSAAAEYFGINEDAALQKMLHAQAGKMRGTPMPQGMTTRDQYIAPSIFDVASSTIERIRGGQDEQAALAKLQAGILRKKDINTSAMQADMQRRSAEAAADQAREPVPGAGEGWTTPQESPALTDAVPSGDPFFGTDLRPKAPGKPAMPWQVPMLLPKGKQTQSPLFGFNDIMGLFGRK